MRSMKCDHWPNCFSFLIRQVDDEVVPWTGIPQVLGDRCEYVCVLGGGMPNRGWGQTPHFTSIWETSVPAGPFATPGQATAQVSLQQTSSLGDTGVLSCPSLSKGCLEDRECYHCLPGSLGHYTWGLLFFTVTALPASDRFLPCGCGESVPTHVSSVAPHIT